MAHFRIDANAGPIKQLFWVCFSEKIYEIKFAFLNWKNVFQF